MYANMNDSSLISSAHHQLFYYLSVISTIAAVVSYILYVSIWLKFAQAYQAKDLCPLARMYLLAAIRLLIIAAI